MIRDTIFLVEIIQRVRNDMEFFIFPSGPGLNNDDDDNNNI